MDNHKRPVFETILRRILEKRRFMQALAGPRQGGKTTLVRQAIEKCGLPSRYVSADELTLQDRTWLHCLIGHSPKHSRIVTIGADSSNPLLARIWSMMQKAST